MHRSIRAGVLVALSPFAFSAPSVLAADAESHDAEMAKWMEMAAPGPHHEHLQEMVGRWNVAGKIWMDPSAPPMETTGESEFRLVLGGRFLEQRTTGMSMGMPMEGIGISGYDNLSGKHTSFWIDSWGTLMMMSEGTCTDHCKVITEFGTYPDMMTGAQRNYKMVLRAAGDDRAVLEMYDVSAEGAEAKTMELVYTRAKS